MNIVALPVEDSRDVGNLWREAIEADLSDAIVIGFRKSNGEFYSNINFADGMQALWLLEAAKAVVLKAGKIL